MKQKLWPFHKSKINIVNNTIISSIKQGLVLTVPFILAGSIALMIRSFPLEGYQAFLQSLFGGIIYNLLTFIHSATIGSLSLILILTISLDYGEKTNHEHTFFYPCISLCSYIVFTYSGAQTISTEIFNVTRMFSAILVTAISCTLFNYLIMVFKITSKRNRPGMDNMLNIVVSYTAPCTSIIAFFAVINLTVSHFFGSFCISNIGSLLLLKLFSFVGNNFYGALLFIFIIHIFWFFGIHGNNIWQISFEIFESKMDVNLDLVLAGMEPTQIFTKSFFDVFVLMGGYGCCICMIFAVLIATKRNSTNRLGKIALIPSIFNMSDIMIFGFPIILNPFMLIPFILTPLAVLCTSSLATYLGLVPIVTKTIEWTTPVIFSGYYATGSVAGSILQIINIVMGVLIYIPFVKISEKRYKNLTQKSINEMIGCMVDCERKGLSPNFLSNSSKFHSIAQMLIYDLRSSYENNELIFHYQPQVDYEGAVFGAEALLRWNHPVYGLIYPPLIITLAKEGGFLNELGMHLLEKACKDAASFSEEFAQPLKISVNVVPSQLEDEYFCDNLKRLLEKYDLKNITLAIELTEQIALLSTKVIQTRLSEIRKLGTYLIMDDFGMGHSSMMYLHNNQFDYVKLDGNLVKRLLDNRRSLDIIKSINQLAKSLHFKLVAEYVETLEQRDLLFHTGCSIYQGYLYCKAVPLSECIGFMKNMDTK